MPMRVISEATAIFSSSVYMTLLLRLSAYGLIAAPQVTLPPHRNT